MTPHTVDTPSAGLSEFLFQMKDDNFEPFGPPVPQVARSYFKAREKLMLRLQVGPEGLHPLGRGPVMVPRACR